jgi:hypothetical protein
MIATRLMEFGNYVLSFSIFGIILFVGFLASLFIKPSPLIDLLKERGILWGKQVKQEEI